MSETALKPVATVKRAWSQWFVTPPGPGGGIPVADRGAGIALCHDRGWKPVGGDGRPLSVPGEKEMNPRYLAYCRALGTPDPEERQELDQEKWPGGKMTGFILWMKERWPEWREFANCRTPVLTEEHYQAFDAWLQAKYPPA